MYQEINQTIANLNQIVILLFPKSLRKLVKEPSITLQTGRIIDRYCKTLNVLAMHHNSISYNPRFILNRNVLTKPPPGLPSEICSRHRQLFMDHVFQ